MCLPRFRNWLQGGLLIVACIGWPETGVAQRSQEASPDQWMLRTYEVDDLVLDVRDHPYGEAHQGGRPSGTGGGLGGGGGGLFSVPDDADTRSGGLGQSVSRSARARYAQFGGGRDFKGGEARSAQSHPGPANITIDDLERVIVTTIDTDSWAANGTGEGQIEHLGTSLVVWQSAAVHDQIQALLGQLRAGSTGRATVAVDARWLLLNTDDLGRLVVQQENGGPTVDRDVLDEFTRRSGSIRGITNCFSGQLVYLVSGTRRNYVKGFIPVVGSLDDHDRGGRYASDQRRGLVRFVAEESLGRGSGEKGVGYQPIVDVENLGALLEIRPTLMRDGKSAVVDLKSTITVPGEQARGIPGAMSLVPSVDRFAIETQELATSLRMPLEKPLLVGGLTYVPGDKGDDGTQHRDDSGQSNRGQSSPPDDAEEPQLYFVLELSSLVE